MHIATQIWIALCMYLLLAYLKYSSKISGSLQRMIRLLQLNLFARRDLLALLHGDPPKPKPPDLQMSMALI
jgi:putative transposase